MDLESTHVCSKKRLPWLLKFRSSQRLIILTICAATFTDGFIYSVFVPILPLVLHDRYNIDLSHVQVWTSGLLGTFGALIIIASPIVGWKSDGSHSRNAAYNFGLFCLAGGIVTLVITNQIWMLVFSRILQGLSAAVVYTVGLTIITDTVDPEEIGHYMGYALSAMSFGVLAGPPIGSLVYSLNYIAVVFLMAGVALVDIVLRLVMIEKGTARVLQENAYGCTERTRLLDETLTSKLQPARPGIGKTLKLLSNPGIATALYGVFVHFVIICSFDGVLPIYLAQTLQWSSLKVGLCFLAIGIPNVILGPLAGKLSDTLGPRWLACGGCVLTSLPMVLLQLVHENTESQILLLFFSLALLGTTLPFIASPLAADLFYIVEILEAEGDGAAYAQSYGLFTCALAGGTLGGPVIAGYLKEKFGWNVMTWGLGALVASGAVPVYFYTGHSHFVDYEDEINND